MIYLTTILISMILTLVLIPIFQLLAVKLNIMDVPDTRKIHVMSTPKSGGMAVILGMLIPVLLWAPINEEGRAILIASGIIVIFGLLDDLKELDYKKKLLGQLTAALIIVIYGGIKIQSLGALLPADLLLPDWLAVPLTIFVIMGVTNAINLADGLDGLAGGICLFSFICIGYLGYRSENLAIALFAAAIGGALFGFLRFNTHPAILFMGDTGSQFLGFVVVTLSLSLTQGNTPFSPVLPLLLIGFPIIDTLTVMTERIVKGRSPFTADKKHFHHKLMNLNLSHTSAVFIIYIFQAFLVTSAFLFRFYSEWFLLILYLVFSGVVTSGLIFTGRTGWKFKRSDYFDHLTMGKLQYLKDKKIAIIVSFKIIEVGVPLQLIFTAFLATRIPRYFSYFSLGLIGLILASWLSINRKKIINPRTVLYIFIPLLIYLTHVSAPSWMNGNLVPAYNLSFGFLAFFAVLTLIFSRRAGFQATPMDFIILFVALFVPNLPDVQIKSYEMGLVAAKIVVMFFAYDILIGELRGDQKKIELTTLIALVLIIIKGFAF